MKMTQLMQGIQKVQELSEENSSQNLLEEIRDIKQQIACNEGWFAMEIDEDLIEACVYQGQALRARYRYLMRKARKEHIKAPIFQ